ncbi:MAG: HupE/UreJ family protein [Planctomycetota bacterium]
MSSSRVELGATGAVATLAFANADVAATGNVDPNRDGALDAAELAAHGDAVIEMLCDNVELAIGGAPCAVQRAAVRLADNRDVVLDLSFGTVPEAVGDSLGWRVGVLSQMARGHRHWAVLASARGAPLAEALLSATSPQLLGRADAAPPAPFDLALEFVGLGVEHILIGYDHILFLLGLLAVGGGWLAAAKVITAFTVAHSVTLAGASLGLVQLPGALVEAVIAGSVVFVGLDNLRRGTPSRRWLCAFGFGLVHGFGFASVLAELGLAGAGGVVVPLLAFNAGVEIGQLAIAAAALPALAWLGRRCGPGRVRAGLSVAVAAAGAYWLIERTVLGA